MEEYKIKLKSKLNSVNSRIQKQKKRNYSNWKYKQIKNELKRDDNNDNLQEFERLREYKSEKIYETIVERMNKIENLK